MKIRPVLFAAAVACLCGAGVAGAQSLTAEGAVTTGVSSDDVAVAATQMRAFGDLKAGIRYYAELAWARTSDEDSDAFGAAYPYRNKLQFIEAYGERMFRPGGAVIGVRAGRYRSPFGIYSGSDHAYTGFLRAPLIRYDGYWAISNNFLEQGADLIVGVPRLTVETSLGAPADVGTSIRRPGLDTIVRAQAAFGPVIVGVSHSNTMPYYPAYYAKGRALFTGADLRVMLAGVEVRGELLDGQSFNNVSTTGWYVDGIVHRVFMGPVTAVARIERLDYDVPAPFGYHEARQTVGARIRVLQELAAQVNLIHMPDRDLHEYHPYAFDAGVTYSFRLR